MTSRIGYRAKLPLTRRGASIGSVTLGVTETETIVSLVTLWSLIRKHGGSIIVEEPCQSNCFMKHVTVSLVFHLQKLSAPYKSSQVSTGDTRLWKAGMDEKEG